MALDILTQLAVIAAVGITLKAVGDKLRVPFIVLLILGGTFLASYGMINLNPGLDPNSLRPFASLARTAALIAVVYSSAFYLHKDKIKAQSREIIMLSTIGVLLTALIISGATIFLLPITVLGAVLLGVLLSGTDPAAVSTGVVEGENKVMSLLRAESLFNQPLTIILPLLIFDYLVKPEFALLNVPKFFALVAMGAIVGWATAKAGQKILFLSRKEHEELVGLIIAFSAFAIAENLMGSGILAVAVCSVLLTSGHIPKKEKLLEFNKEIAFMLTVAVFILLGAEFTFQELMFSKIEVFAVIVALFLGRMLMSVLLLKNTALKMKEKLQIGLVAPKGLAPAALAPMLLVLGLPDGETVAKIVYLAIILSVFISLVSMKLFIENPPTKEQEIKKRVEEKRSEREIKKSMEEDSKN